MKNEIGGNVWRDELKNVDFCALELLSEADEVVVHASLGSTVDGAEWDGHEGDARAGDHEVGLSTLLEETWDDVLSKDDRSGKVDGDLVERLLVGVGLEFGDVAVTLDASVDPDGVDVWVLGEELLDVAGDFVDLGVVHDIALNTWQLLLDLLDLVLTAASDDDFLA